MERRVICIKDAPAAIGPYSQGMALSGQKEVFYFSGQLGIDPLTAKMVDGVEAQTKMALKNISALLASQGMDAQNVIKTLVFITDMSNFAAVNGEYAKFFSTLPPARSCVEVSKLPLGGLVEIEVIAAK